MRNTEVQKLSLFGSIYPPGEKKHLYVHFNMSGKPKISIILTMSVFFIFVCQWKLDHEFDLF